MAHYLPRQMAVLGPVLASSVVAGSAFGMLLLLGGGSHSGSFAGRAAEAAEVSAAWLATMTLIRLVFGLAINRMARRRVMVAGEQEGVAASRREPRRGRGRQIDPVVHHGHPLSRPLLRQPGVWRVVFAREPAVHATGLWDRGRRGILGAGELSEIYLHRIDLAALTSQDFLSDRGLTTGRLSGTLKRLCDLSVGCSMLMLLLPLMAITAVAIKIDSRGPVLHRQRRVGRFDRPFTLFSFRSMTTEASGGGPHWTRQQGPQITQVGRFIRASRIDKLPQLANVIRGEMSLVGPRPERPHFVGQLARAIPFYHQRHDVRPGLTGWAQVNLGRAAAIGDAREKLAYDLYYVRNHGITLDFIILLSTVRVVLRRRGAG